MSQSHGHAPRLRLSKPRLGLKVGHGMGRQGSRISPSWASTKDVRSRLDLAVRQFDSLNS